MVRLRLRMTGKGGEGESEREAIADGWLWAFNTLLLLSSINYSTKCLTDLVGVGIRNRTKTNCIM